MRGKKAAAVDVPRSRNASGDSTGTKTSSKDDDDVGLLERVLKASPELKVIKALLTSNAINKCFAEGNRWQEADCGQGQV